MSLTTVTILIHRLRQRHRQLLREEVERTVMDPAEVEAPSCTDIVRRW